MVTEPTRTRDEDEFDFRVRGSLRGRVGTLILDPDRVVIEEPRDGYVYEDRSHRPRPQVNERNTAMTDAARIILALVIIALVVLGISQGWFRGLGSLFAFPQYKGGCDAKQERLVGHNPGGVPVYVLKPDC